MLSRMDGSCSRSSRSASSRFHDRMGRRSARAARKHGWRRLNGRKGFPHSRPGFLWLGFGPPLGFSGPMESIEPGNQRAERFSPREWINPLDRRSSRNRLIVLRLSEGNSAIKSSIARPAEPCNRMESSNRDLFRARASTLFWASGDRVWMASLSLRDRTGLPRPVRSKTPISSSRDTCGCNSVGSLLPDAISPRIKKSCGSSVANVSSPTRSMNFRFCYLLARVRSFLVPIAVAKAVHDNSSNRIRR